MTFEDALKRKNELGETYNFDEKTVAKIWVVPEKENDLHAYVTDYRSTKFDDNSAKLYSSNSEYKVCALWTDGINVLKKALV